MITTKKMYNESKKIGLPKHFSNDAVIDKALCIYGYDVHLFHNDTSIDNLIDNAPLPQITALQSHSL